MVPHNVLETLEWQECADNVSHQCEVPLPLRQCWELLPVGKSELEGGQPTAPFHTASLFFLPCLLMRFQEEWVRMRRKRMERCQQKGYSRVMSVDSKRSAFVKWNKTAKRTEMCLSPISSPRVISHPWTWAKGRKLAPTRSNLSGLSSQNISVFIIPFY